jgi:hypothetical protein
MWRSRRFNRLRWWSGSFEARRATKANPGHRSLDLGPLKGSISQAQLRVWLVCSAVGIKCDGIVTRGTIPPWSIRQSDSAWLQAL